MWGPTGRSSSIIGRTSALVSSPSLSHSSYLTSSLSIIPRLKNRPMFLTEPCPLNLISKTEIEGCPSLSPCRQSLLGYLSGPASCLALPVYKDIRLTGWVGRASNWCIMDKISLSFTLRNAPCHRFLILLLFFLEEWIHEWLMCRCFRMQTCFVSAAVTADCRRWHS